LEAGISANHEEGQAADSEPVIGTEVSAEASVRNAVAVVAAALLPVAMVRRPVARSVLLPSSLLDAMLFRRSPRLRVASRLRIVPLRALLIVLDLPLLLLRVLLIALHLPLLLRALLGLVLVLPHLLLSMLLRPVLILPHLLLGMLLGLRSLLLGMLLWLLPLLLLSRGLLGTLLLGLCVLLGGLGFWPALLLGRTTFLFAALLALVLRVSSRGNSSEQGQQRGADDSGGLHEYFKKSGVPWGHRASFTG
jgi:hypothetical protein